MTDQTYTLESATPTVRFATARDYLELLKPRIMALVVFTALVGLVAAQSMTGLVLDPVLAMVGILAIALGSGAAGAINMWYDADIDAVMTRTATRPIPAGIVPRDEALSLGIILSFVSVLLMWMATTVLAAALLAFSIAYYGWFYTMVLKRRTAQNIVIGGAAGAFPPVIGWAAVTGTAPLDAWLLFAIIFFWTPPHFWALSLVAHKEYEKAGVPMMPVTAGTKRTRFEMFVYALVLLPVGLAPVLTGLGGAIYGVSALVMGGLFAAMCFSIMNSTVGDDLSDASARKRALGLFAFSILYLFTLFAALLVEHAFGLHYQIGVF
ncbi:MAG: heme o synthase [Pseudomonadota bacterium]